MKLKLDIDAFELGYKRGIKDVLEMLHENIMIDCELCPYYDDCNNDCDKVLFAGIMEEKASENNSDDCDNCD